MVGQIPRTADVTPGIIRLQNHDTGVRHTEIALQRGGIDTQIGRTTDGDTPMRDQQRGFIHWDAHQGSAITVQAFQMTFTARPSR